MRGAVGFLRAADQQVALQVNPYHLGFSMWEHIVEQEGRDAAHLIMQQDDDFGFIRNHLSRELAEELKLFQYTTRDGQIRVHEMDLDQLHENMLAPKYGFGAPSVSVAHLHVDGTLELEHDHPTDGRGLDLERARRVLEYVRRVWRRPVTLHPLDHEGSPYRLAV